MNPKRLFLFSIFIFSAAALWADSPATVQLRVEATPKKITIGDVVKVEINVMVSSSVTPMPFKPAGLGEFEVRGLNSSEPKLEKQKLVQTHTLYATTFSTGALAIPALALQFKNPDGTLAETHTEEIPIEVRSLLTEKGDEGGLRPVKGLYDFKSYTWLWVILSILAVAGVVFWVAKTSRRGSGENKKQEGPPVPPEQWAWDALHKLEDSDLIDMGQIKEFYSQLSNILREYLERRYAISAMERTTSELLGEFRKLNLQLIVTSRLREFLETGDLVKFAKFTPERDEVEKDLIRIKEVVTFTTPKLKSENPEEVKSEIPV